MTPRERVLAVLRGKKPDKVPFTVYEYKIPQCAVERKLRDDGLCIVNRRQGAVSSETPNCIHETRTYTENGKQRTRTAIRTPVGEISTVSQPAGFTSWTLEKFFKGPEDYKVLLYMAKDTQYKPNYDAFAAAEKWMGEDVICRAGVGSHPLHQIMIGWMGVETFSVEWMERRDEILKLDAAMRENLRKVFPLLAKAPVTHANFGGNEVPEVMGPPRYRQFCIPMIDECAAHFRPKGIKLGSHMDGNNRPWAADLAKCGLDYVEAFTPAPDTDMTLEEALKAWPDKVLWINFPSSVHLSSIEVIKRTAREIVELAKQTDRVIVGITEDIPEDLWQGNLLAISEVINETA